MATIGDREFGNAPALAGKLHAEISILPPVPAHPHRVPALLAMHVADDVGEHQSWRCRIRASPVRLPQVRFGTRERCDERPDEIGIRWLACRRTESTELRGTAYARYTKSGSAMHGMRFSHEIEGYRAEPCRPRPANVCLSAMPKGSTPRHRKYRDGGMAEAEVKRVAQDTGTKDGQAIVSQAL